MRNDFKASVKLEGMVYPSVEHAFQAAKTVDSLLRESIANASDGRSAKQIGQSFDISEDWDEERVRVMEFLIRQKFSEHEDLREKLLNTGDQLIRMVNRRDRFWGMIYNADEGEFIGDNTLGEIIMKVRAEFKQQVPQTKPVEDTEDELFEALDLKLSSDLADAMTTVYKEAQELCSMFGYNSLSSINTLDISLIAIINDLALGRKRSADYADAIRRLGKACVRVTQVLEKNG